MNMQNESQNIEYKESWRDEYLKWICGFANAQGGRIYIGVNDQKEVIGLSDAKRLLEDIPNKIVRSIELWIVAKRVDSCSFVAEAFILSS
jgi:predicted HTH transcriptional regulator